MGELSPKVEPRVSTQWLVGVSLFWFATSFKWFLVLVFLLPNQVARIVPGGEKGAYWGAVFGLGAIWAVVGPALFGSMSDRLGDRRPFILAGSLATVAALALLHSASSIAVLAAGYLVLQIADDLATGPYSAVVPEVIPQERRGAASGIMGAAMSLAQVAAVATAVAMANTQFGMYASIAVLNVLTALLAARLLRRGKAKSGPMKSVAAEFREPWTHRDFRWVWLTRFLVTLGFYLVIPYANFYVRDQVSVLQWFGIDIGSVQNATALLALTLAIAGAVGSVGGGSIIDRRGRKGVTFFGSAVMAAGLAAAVTLPGLESLWGFAIAIGLGYGAFQSANWAMVSDVLPNRADLGRDMGIWQMSISSVQIVSGIAGLVLTFGNRQSPGFGYQILFAFAAFAVLSGGWAASKVVGSR